MWVREREREIVRERTNLTTRNWLHSMHNPSLAEIINTCRICALWLNLTKPNHWIKQVDKTAECFSILVSCNTKLAHNKKQQQCKPVLYKYIRNRNWEWEISTLAPPHADAYFCKIYQRVEHNKLTGLRDVNVPDVKWCSTPLQWSYCETASMLSRDQALINAN